MGNTVQVNVKKCSKCGDHKLTTEFYVDNSAKDGRTGYCKVCSLARQRAWREANRDRDSARERAWRAANPDKVRARKRAWRAANPDKRREETRRWQRANPDKVAAIKHRRRARKQANGVHVITERDLARLYASSCAACGSTENIEADHIIPISRGGQHSIGNLQPLCRSCNASKSDRLLVEWRHAAVKTLAA